MADFIAASTAYATHGEAMIPFYIFYSMFGWQRTADQMWQLGDQLGRGFLVGATAGRTTLTGEGLQHADGHSPVIAATNPAALSYDPAFAYEIAVIVKDGLRRMYGEAAPGEDPNVFYYLTVYNEPMPQPAKPSAPGVDEGIVERSREHGASLVDGIRQIVVDGCPQQCESARREAGLHDGPLVGEGQRNDVVDQIDEGRLGVADDADRAGSAAHRLQKLQHLGGRSGACDGDDGVVVAVDLVTDDRLGCREGVGLAVVLCIFPFPAIRGRMTRRSERIRLRRT